MPFALFLVICLAGFLLLIVVVTFPFFFFRELWGIKGWWMRTVHLVVSVGLLLFVLLMLTGFPLL